jgi:hypothetical protein
LAQTHGVAADTGERHQTAREGAVAFERARTRHEWAPTRRSGEKASPRDKDATSTGESLRPPTRRDHCSASALASRPAFLSYNSKVLSRKVFLKVRPNERNMLFRANPA